MPGGQKPFRCVEVALGVTFHLRQLQTCLDFPQCAWTRMMLRRTPQSLKQACCAVQYLHSARESGSLGQAPAKGTRCQEVHSSFWSRTAAEDQVHSGLWSLPLGLPRFCCTDMDLILYRAKDIDFSSIAIFHGGKRQTLQGFPLTAFSRGMITGLRLPSPAAIQAGPHLHQTLPR